jgi:hypothetical protein
LECSPSKLPEELGGAHALYLSYYDIGPHFMRDFLYCAIFFIAVPNSRVLSRSDSA